MPGTFELKKAKNGEIYFNLKAANGEVILTSETYRRKSNALNGIEAVKKNATLDIRYATKMNKAGKALFVLRAGNHQVLGQSEGYSSESACAAGMSSVKKNAPSAKIHDLTI